MPDTVRRWNPYAQEWETVSVDIAEPARTRRRRRTRTRRPAGQRMPLDHTASVPVKPYWVDTAYAETGPLADMRSWIKPPAMATHRAPAVMPVPDLGHVIEPNARRTA